MSETVDAEKAGNAMMAPPTAEPQQERLTLREKLNKPMSFHLAFLSLIIMVFIVSVDATALAVAIPAIADDLGGTTLEAFWANISFLLTVTITQPIYTSTSDILGRKIPLYAAFFLFSLGSIIFGVAKTMPIVILGRAVQGLGGGGIDVLNEVIVADITTLRERAFYIGIMSVPMALGTILGPILGAIFSEYVSWRWIGWINLPLVGICTPLTIFFLRLKPMSDTFTEQLKRIDWIGIGLFTAGAVLFTLPLSWAGSMYAWASWQTLVPLCIGAVVLIIFSVYEKHPVEPVFPYRIFNNRTAVSTVAGSFIHGLILYTLIAYLPLFFQSVFLENPLQSAISIIPFCAVMMAFTLFAAMGVDFTRRYLWEIWLGWVFTALGAGLFGLWQTDSTTAQSAGFQIVAAIGLGTLFSVPPIPMQASAERMDDQGLAIGIMVAFRLFGALIGLALAATAFSSQFGKAIGNMGHLPKSIALLENPNEALGFIPYLRSADLPADVLADVQNAYATSLKTVFYILAAFGGLGLFASLFTKELAIESEETGKQAFEA